MRYTLILVLFSQLLWAQNPEQLTQTVRGTVTNKTSGEALAFITVAVTGTSTGAVTDEQGRFTLENVPLGRHTIHISGIGYETVMIREVLVSSAKEVELEVELTEKYTALDEVVVKPRVNKDRSLNDMSLLGSQMFSVEEAARFAGGMDDPARLVSNYAGVTTTGTSNNGISIRGNAPALLQWRLEDVEIPNPNHFADIDVLGGGFLSALSGNVLGNSDFFIGAFPAEYHNAVSGVFDMKLRNGSHRKYQHTFQLGILGIDFASEGPLSRAKRSSYLINYRYSTTGLLEKLQRNKEMGGTLGYQDLNFKLHLPTRNAGTFSLWGMGLIDEVAPIPEESPERKYLDEGILSSARQKSGALGVSHRYFFANHKTSLKTTLATTHSGNHIEEEFYDLNRAKSPKTDLAAGTTRFVLTSALNHRFNPRHTHKTGVTLTHIRYSMALDFTPFFGRPLENFSHSEGNTNLLAAWSQSLIRLGENLTLTAGLNLQHLTLTGKTALEPRAGLQWQATPKSSFALGYGLHSRMEKPDVYFVKDSSGNLPNKDLDFTRSHHLMLAYTYKISEEMSLKIEPYFQSLYRVPVAGTYSILNRKEFYMTRALVSQGKGRNYGVDLTFSKYLTQGMYYMLTASRFRSEYRAADRNWYSTRYNREYTVNALIGKEWMLGQNLLGVNLKAGAMGGQRYTPADESATLEHPDKEVQYDETQMFSRQFSPMFVGDFSVSYTINRRKTAHTFSIKSANATRQKEYIKHKYNLLTETIEPFYSTNSLFNVSYRIDF